VQNSTSEANEMQSFSRDARLLPVSAGVKQPERLSIDAGFQRAERLVDTALQICPSNTASLAPKLPDCLKV
jgi:hypothetical protein